MKYFSAVFISILVVGALTFSADAKNNFGMDNKNTSKQKQNLSMKGDINRSKSASLHKNKHRVGYQQHKGRHIKTY